MNMPIHRSTMTPFPRSTSEALPLPSDQDATGRTLGDEEIAAVTEALRSGTLTSTKGRFTKKLETDFATLIGAKYAHACSSGSAAVHCAIAAVDPEPGDEIITTSITDMGALTPILYQGAIPVFADVDPVTGNVTPETVAARLSPRTKAIVATHLFGNPCDMRGLRKLADERGIVLIEDAAQAFLAKQDGKYIGTLGHLGCFSLQQGKHITTGEGGLVTSDDPELARRVFLFINKAWGYGDAQPDHYFLALNYRMCELQGSVAAAQLPKLPDIVAARRQSADLLTELIADLPGASAPQIDPSSKHVYWKYPLMVDGDRIEGGAVGLAKFLKERGIASAPRYIQKPAFRCMVFRDQKTFGSSRFPFTLARPEAVDYREELFPGTFRYLEQVLVLPWNERYTETHVEYIATALQEGVERLRR